MADRPKDPAAMFQSLLTDWERTFNSTANSAMGTEHFGKLLKGAAGVGLKAREVATDASRKYLATMNLPSRDELAAIGERVALIERQIGLLHAKLDLIAARLGAPLAEAPAPVARPPRTRRPEGPPPAGGAGPDAAGNASGGERGRQEPTRKASRAKSARESAFKSAGKSEVKSASTPAGEP